MWPKTFRGRVLLLMMIVVSLVILIFGYLATIGAEKALLEEKRHKLFGAARMLDYYLTGTFDDVLQKFGAENESKEVKVAILNKQLQGYTDQVAAAYPGIGVGYYVKNMDVQATYGPSRLYSHQVGLSIGPDHEGRKVMASGKEILKVGKMMRGSIMNAMHPLHRNGEVIGYIYANELTEDIDSQIGELKWNMYLLSLLGFSLGLAGVSYVANRLARHIEIITGGLTALSNDMTSRLPPMSGELGQIAVAINEMAADLMRKNKLEDHVQRVERLSLVGEVAAGLAHEIRNPLMAIRGFTQLLGEEVYSNDEKKEYIAIIIKETERMDALIEQLMGFARPLKTEVKNINININKEIERILHLVNTKATMGNISIQKQLGQDLPTAVLDVEKLRQVLLNILLNSIQAINEKNGVIFVDTKYCKINDSVYIVIKDTGTGIGEIDIEKIFEPFFTTKETGTGLGLSVACRSAESWGGKISVVSVLGEGSEFTVTIPMVRSEKV